MRLLSCLLALCLGLVLLRVDAVERGSACPMSGQDAAHGAMADMAMPEDPTTGADSADGAHVPCNLPWAPGECLSMAPCVPAAIASAAMSLPADVPPHPAVPVLVALAPTSPSLPPEIPPPRA